MQQPERTDDPPSFGEDSERSWDDLMELPPTQTSEEATLAWSRPLGEDASGRIASSPTVLDGGVFVTNGSTLYELDAEDGSVVWRFESTFGLACSPTVVDGVVYFVTVLGSVGAVEVGDDEVRWESEHAGEYSRRHGFTPSPLVVDGSVYVGTAPGVLYAYDAASGDVTWTFPTNGPIQASAVWYDGSLVVPSSDGTLYSVDPADGSENWSVSIDGIGYGSPTIADGTVYIGSETGSVHALDADSGETRWTRERDGSIVATPTVADGTVFVTDVDDLAPALVALEADSGEPIWNSRRALTTCSPTVAGNRVYFGKTYVQGHEVESGTRELIFTERGGGFDSSPIVVDGRLYVGGPNGNLVAIDTNTNATSSGSRVQEGSLGHTSSLVGASAGRNGTGSSGSSAGSGSTNDGAESGSTGDSGDDSLAGPGILGSVGSLLGARFLLGSSNDDQVGENDAERADDQAVSED